MGLYPLAGQPLYLIGSPLFTSTTIHLGNDNAFTVLAANSSNSAIYVQSAELNGKPLHRAWLTHREIIAGGQLTLHMGDHPQPWDTELPPNGKNVWQLIK